MLTDFAHRLRSIVRRGAVERELDEELRFHLEAEIGKRVAAGVPPGEAARQARLALGGIEQIKDAHRDARGITLLETVVQDVRYGLRAMRRSPAFAFTAVATIALSTAALASVFTLGYTLLYRWRPVDRPDQLVDVAATRLRSNTTALTAAEAARLQILGPVSYPDYLAFRRGTRTLSGLAADYPTAPLFVTVNGDGREINGAVVSANFFPVLGLRPALGRFFHDDEDRVPDRDRVAVIGPQFWRTWLGGSPSAIGSHVRINGTDFTIIGVASSDFAGLTPRPIEIYIPTAMLRVGYRWCDDALASDCGILQMIGRLAPGRTVADAAAELPTLMPAAWAHAPRGENSGVAVSQRRGMSEDDQEPRLVRILAAVAVVLLFVCCANLAGLVGAQSAARAHEFTVRLSLGAAPRRVVRQLTTEAAMLAGAGGVAGLMLSRAFIAALSAMFFAVDDEGHLLYYDFGQTPAIALATIGVALAAGLLFSIVPAIGVARRPAVARLTARSATSRRSSGAWLLGAQAAVAVAMVAVAALLATSARTMLAGRNFEASHVALIRVRPRLVKYAPERAQRFQREVVRRLEATPGVESVSMVGIGAVLSGSSVGVALPESGPGHGLRARYNEIGARYFATLSTPIASGREFDEHDSLQAARVAIVNETLAARLWPGGRSIDATVIVGTTPHRIVGVVADVSLRSRGEGAEPWIYVPFWQNPAQIDARLAIRVSGDPASMLPAIVREVNHADPNVPVAETITLPDQLAGLLRPVRVSATFVGYTAVLAVLLTAIGLYASLAFAVSRRTREIGIRMALGAARPRIVGSIIGEGLVVIGGGAIAGIALAVAGTRVMTHLLYGSASADWIVYASAVGLVLMVGMVASWLPARRAAAIEPLVALRCE
jgi:putative ABC transport system permease protein